MTDAEPIRSAAILQQVRAEQIRTLFKQSAPVLLANVVNAVIVSVALWSHAPHRMLVGWTAAMALMALMRIEMRRRYWMHDRNPAEEEIWGTRFALGSLSAGLLWGFMGGVLLPDSLPLQVVVIFVIGGMAAAAAGTISCFMRAYYAYLVPSLLPVMLRLLAFGGEEHFAMVAMLVLFMGALTLVARNVHQALAQAFQLRFENAVLLSQVSEAQAALVEANEGLSRSNELLEGRVRERTVELGESQRELAEIVRESPDGIVILDDAGAVVTVNPAAERIAGRRADGFIGAHFVTTETLIGKDASRAIESFQGLLQGEERAPEEFQIQRPDGQTAVIEVHPRVVVGIDGRRRIHTVIRDVTERHRVQRLKDEYEGRLRQAQRLESVGMLAGGVAHDFNNVLTMILSNTDALASSSGADPEARELLSEIRHGSLQAANLTKQLLAFSRQQVLNVKPTNLVHLLNYVHPMLERALGEQSTLAISLPAEPVVVLADGTQLEQAIINLLVNANHAMPRGGMVKIDVCLLEIADDPDWPDVPGGKFVRISISDTGVGMDEATRIRVFDPFFTTKELGHGTGLGLSTVHGIVKQAGGHIRVTSEPGHGTCFEVLLPHHAALKMDAARPAIPVWTAGSGTVLVVEDQPQVQRAARRILKAAGYRVLHARNGEQALQLVREHDGRIDLLVTDVIMPGLSGVELCRRMLELDPELAVLFVSGYAGKEITELTELGPEVEFLQKPFDAVSLTSSVRAALERRGKGGGRPPPRSRV